MTGKWVYTKCGEELNYLEKDSSGPLAIENYPERWQELKFSFMIGVETAYREKRLRKEEYDQAWAFLLKLNDALEKRTASES